jgi:hypothetical protein
MDETRPPDLQRLASHARTRRHDLGLPITGIAAKAGLSKDTYVRIERGKPVSASSYAKVEAALGWAVGAVRRVLDGGEPVLAAPEMAMPDLGHALASAVTAVAAHLAGAGQARDPRAVVQSVTRTELHDAIRTLARTDPAWWRGELNHMARMAGRKDVLG